MPTSTCEPGERRAPELGCSRKQCSLCFLWQEGNQLRFSWSGNLMANCHCHSLRGRKLLGECSLVAAIWAFPSTKLLFFRASTRGRSTHASSVGSRLLYSVKSGHPSSPQLSAWDSPDPKGVSHVLCCPRHMAMTSRCPQTIFADISWESTWASLSLPSFAVHSKGGGSITKCTSIFML